MYQRESDVDSDEGNNESYQSYSLVTENAVILDEDSLNVSEMEKQQ